MSFESHLFIRLYLDETIHRLLNLLNRVTADEMRNQLRWLQAFK